jgi:reactive chlorine resistance protein C
MNTRVEIRTDLPLAAGGEIARTVALQSIGTNVLRYSLILVFLLFGATKFTAAEAAAIKPLVSNSPLMSWLYSFLSEQGVSNLIGSSELLTAALLAARPFSARVAAIGGALAACTFLTTLSFLFSTPGALSPMHPAHAFLVKDIVLLGAALALGTEALRAIASEADRRARA